VQHIATEPQSGFKLAMYRLSLRLVTVIAGEEAENVFSWELGFAHSWMGRRCESDSRMPAHVIVLTLVPLQMAAKMLTPRTAAGENKAARCVVCSSSVMHSWGRSPPP